jgi:hypothetical protein
LYNRLIRLAAEERKTPSDSLPDPSEVGFSASETEWMWDLFVMWTALGEPPQVSVLVNEIISGYGGIIAGLLEMKSLYAKVKQKTNNEQNSKK